MNHVKLMAPSETFAAVLAPMQLRGQRNIVGMLGSCKTTVVTEYFPTNLLKYVYRHGTHLPFGQIVSMSLDAVKGLQVWFYRPRS